MLGNSEYRKALMGLLDSSSLRLTRKNIEAQLGNLAFKQQYSEIWQIIQELRPHFKDTQVLQQFRKIHQKTQYSLIQDKSAQFPISRLTQETDVSKVSLTNPNSGKINIDGDVDISGLSNKVKKETGVDSESQEKSERLQKVSLSPQKFRRKQEHHHQNEDQMDIDLMVRHKSEHFTLPSQSQLPPKTSISLLLRSGSKTTGVQYFLYDSDVITSEKHRKIVSSWFPVSIKGKKLNGAISLFSSIKKEKGSRVENFKKQCYDIPNILVFGRTTKNQQIVGGFTPKPFSKQPDLQEYEHLNIGSFVFNLTKGILLPIKQGQMTGKQKVQQGPSFGKNDMTFTEDSIVYFSGNKSRIDDPDYARGCKSCEETARNYSEFVTGERVEEFEQIQGEQRVEIDCWEVFEVHYV